MLIAPLMRMDMITQRGKAKFSTPSPLAGATFLERLPPTSQPLCTLKKLPRIFLPALSLFRQMNGLRNHPSQKLQCLTFRRNNEKTKQSTELIILKNKVLIDFRHMLRKRPREVICEELP
jgi:hypothetical protein